MRVIAGTARGRTLRTVRGRSVRPTADRVKESLFNVLQALVADADFLDLFAGSGAVGIEALSRGARRAVFVEQAASHLRVLAANLAATGLADRAQIIQGDVLQMVAHLPAAGFDLVFLDPPYGRELVPPTLTGLAAVPVLRPGGLAVAEHHRRDPTPESAGGLARLRELAFGETVLTVYRQS